MLRQQRLFISEDCVLTLEQIGTYRREVDKDGNVLHDQGQEQASPAGRWALPGRSSVTGEQSDSVETSRWV
jgi:hypothetical protein